MPWKTRRHGTPRQRGVRFQDKRRGMSLRDASRKRVEDTRVRANWHTEVHPPWREAGEESTVWKGYYKGFEITVYPLRLVDENANGWEYKLFHPAKTEGADWDSAFETSGGGGDHARSAEEAKRWATQTVDTWEN